MSFDVVLAIICIFQLTFTAAVLFTHSKGKTISNFLLGTFFLAMAINFTDGILILKGAYLNFPGFAFIGNVLSVTYGPLIYLYTLSVVYQDFKLKTSLLIHFIPLLITALITVSGYHLQSREMKLFILEQAAKRITPEPVYFITFLILALLIGYILRSINLLIRYREKLSLTYSSLDTRNLSWFNGFLVLFLITIGFSIIHSFLPLFGWEDTGEMVLILIITANFLLINIVLFKAIRQPDIFAGIKLPEEKNTAFEPEAGQVTGYKEIGERIKSRMLAEKFFLESDLTLEQLALKLDLKPRVLSQVINQQFNRNFFDFVNGFRIEEAKGLLKSPDDPKTTIQEIMYQVGFNSKSSFNTIFKKFTGLTPSEFKKQHPGSV